MWFCGPKEKKEEPKNEYYYAVFECTNCYAPNMAIKIPLGVRISEFIEDKSQKPVHCSKCGCYTSRKDGIKIAEKEKK